MYKLRTVAGKCTYSAFVVVRETASEAKNTRICSDPSGAREGPGRCHRPVCGTVDDLWVLHSLNIPPGGRDNAPGHSSCHYRPRLVQKIRALSGGGIGGTPIGEDLEPREASGPIAGTTSICASRRRSLGVVRQHQHPGVHVAVNCALPTAPV